MSMTGYIAAVAVPVAVGTMPSYTQFTAAEWAIIIGAIGGVVAMWRQGNKTQGLKEQVAQIHEVTNSNLSTANNKIDKQLIELQALHDMIRELKGEREKKEIIASAEKAVI